mmetsp:Transcript_100671/g.280443  ORF Transcript_100671/g.280443 Transcript_100671/m.280443 type:complete len:246 (+) Transcript_100671:62-799(+)
MVGMTRLCVHAVAAAAIVKDGVGFRVSARRDKEDTATKASPDEQAHPFFQLPVESELPPSAFACHEGLVFGVTLPAEPGAGPGKNATFHYVKHYPTGQEGVDIYKDLYDETRHFIAFAPLDDWSEDFRMVCRTWTGAEESDGWGDQRLFSLGASPPCVAQPAEGEAGAAEAAEGAPTTAEGKGSAAEVEAPSANDEVEALIAELEAQAAEEAAEAARAGREGRRAGRKSAGRKGRGGAGKGRGGR